MSIEEKFNKWSERIESKSKSQIKKILLGIVGVITITFLINMIFLLNSKQEFVDEDRFKVIEEESKERQKDKTIATEYYNRLSRIAEKSDLILRKDSLTQNDSLMLLDLRKEYDLILKEFENEKSKY